ncbi:MAG: DUF4421 family protein [Pseudobdellovibrionaceae bacterium]
MKQNSVAFLVLFSSLIIAPFTAFSAEARSDEANWENRQLQGWNLKTGIQSRRVYVEIPGSGQLGTQAVKYYPEAEQSFFAALEKNQVGFSASLNTLFNKNSDKSYQDYRLYKYDEKWSSQASWMRYKGFKVNKSDIPNIRQTTAERSDIVLEGWNLGGMYNFFSDKVSLPAIFNGSARQKKSGGTVLGTGSLSQTSLKSDRGLIPYPQDSQECCTYKNDLNIYSASVGALGIYNFVFLENWLTGLGWGVELGTQKVAQSLGPSSAFEAFAFNRYFLNFGYQGDKFYALIYFLENTHQVSPTQIEPITLGSTYSNFIVGYYF